MGQKNWRGLLQFVACQLQSHLELGPVNSSPLPAGAVLGLTAEGTGGTLQAVAEGWLPCLHLPVLGCLLWRRRGPFHHHPKWTASSCQFLACRLRPSSGLLQHSLTLSVIKQAAALSSPRTSEPQLRFGGGVCSKWVGGYSPKHRGSDVTYFCCSVELSFTSLNSSPPFISS